MLIINAIERICIVVGDIPGALLQADYPEDEGKECYLKFEGVMVDMICEIKPEYAKLIKLPRKARNGCLGK
jgi:hypothetical protein